MTFARRFVFAALLLFGAAASAQNLSNSKLSIHLINNYSSGSAAIVSGKPRVLKVLGLTGGFPNGMILAMRDYKARVPDGKVVVRVYSPQLYFLSNNATQSAGTFWTNILKASLDTLSSSDKALIDYLEGPNEGQTPTLGYPNDTAEIRLQASQWFNEFWTNLTPHIVSAGFKPCIGSIAVGNPGSLSDIDPFIPALRQAKATGGGWSYHAYTIHYTTDVGTEWWYSLRYRQFYQHFAANYPDLVDIPLILTEGGVDFDGTPNTSGWQARGPASHYQRWLNWYDHRMAEDSYVLGCTLFQNGDPGGWSSFEIEPIANWLGSYLTNPTAVPAAPTGLGATMTNGRIQLAWNTVPANPITWNVKRSLTNSGPYTTIATGITEGVAATAYTDISFVPNLTNYYVVSAVNAHGESVNSSSVSAYLTNTFPDMVVTAIAWAPTNPVPGANVLFRATVLNQGNAPVSAGTIMGIGFLVDGPQVCWASTTLANSLAPNASMTLTANGGGVYWPATEGTHVVSAHVDDVNRFLELSENNNVLSVPLNVVVPPPRFSGISALSENVNLTWQTFPGKTYRVEFKSDLSDANWAVLGSNTVAAGNSLSTTNNVAGNHQRFYRIVQVD